VEDVRKLFDRDDIDAVSIATPNHTHAILSILAMQSGKDVHVEKPCSHNLAEGREMVRWARKVGRICQMRAQSRSMNGMRKLLAFIRSGRIGKVSVAQALGSNPRESIGPVDTPAADLPPVPETGATRSDHLAAKGHRRGCPGAPSRPPTACRGLPNRPSRSGRAGTAVCRRLTRVTSRPIDPFVAVGGCLPPGRIPRESWIARPLREKARPPEWCA